MYLSLYDRSALEGWDAYTDSTLPLFPNISETVITMYLTLLGNYEHDRFLKSNHSVMATLLFVMFTFGMSIIMFNLLIAIMADTFCRVRVDELATFLHTRAGTICDMQKVTWQHVHWDTYVHCLLPKRSPTSTSADNAAAGSSADSGMTAGSAGGSTDGGLLQQVSGRAKADAGESDDAKSTAGRASVKSDMADVLKHTVTPQLTFLADRLRGDQTHLADRLKENQEMVLTKMTKRLQMLEKRINTSKAMARSDSKELTRMSAAEAAAQDTSDLELRESGAAEELGTTFTSDAPGQEEQHGWGDWSSESWNSWNSSWYQNSSWTSVAAQSAAPTVASIDSSDQSSAQISTGDSGFSAGTFVPRSSEDGAGTSNEESRKRITIKRKSRAAGESDPADTSDPKGPTASMNTAIDLFDFAQRASVARVDRTERDSGQVDRTERESTQRDEGRESTDEEDEPADGVIEVNLLPDMLDAYK